MEKKKEKKNWLWVIIGILIIVVILLLLRSCGTEQVVNPPISNEPIIEEPVGNFEVSGEKKEEGTVEKENTETPTITFAGYGKYIVSADKPTVEFHNPEGNFVDMVFTLKDKSTGKVIARTDKVQSGKYVYVNVMDFFSEKGTYNVLISVSTYDNESGAQMNGMEQEMQIIVK